MAGPSQAFTEPIIKTPHVRESAMKTILQEVTESDIPSELNEKLTEEKRMEAAKRKEHNESSNYISVNDCKGAVVRELNEGMNDGMNDGSDKGRVEGMNDGVGEEMDGGRVEGMNDGVGEEMDGGRVEGMNDGVGEEMDGGRVEGWDEGYGRGKSAQSRSGVIDVVADSPIYGISVITSIIRDVARETLKCEATSCVALSF